LECFKEAALIGMKVVQVSCGENHTLALVEMSHEVEKNVSRKLFVWGNNDKWQLGMDSGNSNPTEDT
jgi:alpha-tubulin suppressor-like RCC1 family protein